MLPLGCTKREYILDGIRQGFRISETDNSEIRNVFIKNSASAKMYHVLVEQQILEEIVEGNYIIVPEQPKIVSAIGAIPKSNDKVRLIHDGSRPIGTAMNDYVQDT